MVAKVIARVQINPKQKAPVGGSEKSSHMSVNGSLGDDY